MQRNRHRASQKPGRNTLCDRFCDTYIAEGKINSFILLPKLLVDKRLAENITNLLSPSGRAENLCDFDGTPSYRIRHKFHRTIRNRGNSATGLYGALECIFSEQAIKELFVEPNVWLLNHNERARKQNATEESRLNHAKKVDPKGFALRKQCERRMQNMSVVRMVREERMLAQ